MELTGEPDGPPTRVGVSMIDSMSGLTGIVGLLSLPAARPARPGRAATSTPACTMSPCTSSPIPASGTSTRAMSRRACRAARICRWRRCRPSRRADGWIFIMCMTQKFWLSLCRRWAATELARRSALSRSQHARENRAALTDALDPTFRTRTTAAVAGDVQRAAAGRAGLSPRPGARQRLRPRDRHGLGRAASGEGRACA